MHTYIYFISKSIVHCRRQTDRQTWCRQSDRAIIAMVRSRPYNSRHTRVSNELSSI